jgi:hypothetical protein
MRRRLMIGFIVVLAGLMTAMSAHAFQVCWQLQDGAPIPNNLLDFLRLSAEEDKATSPRIFRLSGCDDASPLYQACGAGSATQNTIGDLSKYRLSINLHHTTPGFFGNNRVGGFTALLTANPDAPDFLDGTWEMQFAGPTLFNVSGKLVFVDCPVFEPAVASTQGSDARVQMNVFDEGLAAQIAQDTQSRVDEHERMFGEVRAAGKGNFIMIQPQ